jgi:hypothetical protein
LPELLVLAHHVQGEEVEMEGRWTLLVDRADWAVTVDPDVSVFPQHGESLVPVVPVDDAAVTRAREAYEAVIDAQRCYDAPTTDDVIEAVLRALAS